MPKHIDIIKEAELTWLHVFPYSPRPNTPAARMPQVAKNIRRERSAELRKIGEVTASNHLNSYVGFDLAVLVEKQGMGRTESYAKVSIDGNPAEGTIVNTHILRSDGSKLYGQIV